MIFVANAIIFSLTWGICHLLKSTVLNGYNFNTSYFMLHFITNCIITSLCFPYFLTLFKDPNGIESDYEEYGYIRYSFPIIASLHTYHLYNSYDFINLDEIIHHFVTYVFWIICQSLSHPFYYVSLICMSGVPGGITYLMLFMQKHNIMSSLNEKYYSMLLNIWMRGPGCIIYSTLLYDRMIYIKNGDFCPIHLFLIGFTILNGIHFTTTIFDSYYRMLYSKIN
jgi:hypothetical protein